MPGRLTFTIVVLDTAYLLVVLELVRRRHLREKYAFLWLAVGFVLLILGFSRTLLDRFANAIGIGYGPTVLFLFAILFLMAVAAHLSWEVSRLEEKTRRLAEEIALLRPRRPEPVEDDARR